MKKLLKWLFLTLLTIVLLFSIYAVASGKSYLFKAILYNYAGIDDYEKFSNNTVETGTPQPWLISSNFNKPVLAPALEQLLDQLKSVGVLVVKEDSVLFEKFWMGYSDSSYSGSFSMAKSIASLLVGAALKEGKIGSLEDPVGKYLPEFSEGEKSKLKIVHLLTMSSGSSFVESYADPFSPTTELYYGDDVYKTATKVTIQAEPGTRHDYKSGDTQLLGLIIEKATGKPLSVYASEKLWQPMGAEHPALWSVDHKDGHVKAYCCFNSNVRDFARLGKLMLDSGSWKGQEIITKDYYTNSIRPCMLPDENNVTCDYYGYQWWLVPHRPGIFYARGILGQYVIVIPSKKMVIVRLGKLRSSNKKNTVPEEVDALIDWGMGL